METECKFTGTHDLFNVEIGHEITPLEMVITEEMVERHCWANDDYNPWYLENSPFGCRIASPTFLAYDTDLMIWSHFILPEGKGVWAKQEFKFLNPLKVGKIIKITGRVTDRINKRGRDHISFEFLVTEEGGCEIVRMRSTHAFPLIARCANK